MSSLVVFLPLLLLCSPTLGCQEGGSENCADSAPPEGEVKVLNSSPHSKSFPGKASRFSLLSSDVSSEMCVDAAPATYCTMNRHFCREPSLTVSTDCAKSCEVCNATPAVESSCSDEAPICSLLVNHCGDASQFDYLSKNCAKTCKFCGDTTTPEPEPTTTVPITTTTAASISTCLSAPTTTTTVSTTSKPPTTSTRRTMTTRRTTTTAPSTIPRQRGDCADTLKPSDCDAVKNLCHLYNTETWGEGGFDILKKCPVTCNLCDKRPHNPKTTTTITPTPQNCIEDKQCPEWASNGLCIHPFYPRDFLQRKCPLSCGFCGVPMVTPDPQSCIDEKGCPEWVSNGFCTYTFYPREFRRKKCPVSCGFCGVPMSTPTTPSSQNCVDELGCTTWVSNGFCTNTFYTPELRRQKCSRSCGFCGGPMSNGYTNNYQYTRRTTVNYNAGNGNGVCVDKKAECATQASCNSTNPTYLAWVRDLCPRTCGVC